MGARGGHRRSPTEEEGVILNINDPATLERALGRADQH